MELVTIGSLFPRTREWVLREMSRVKQITCMCAIVGAVAWVAACLALASLPTGCVAEECETRPQRDWSPLATSLVVVAFVLVTASALGLVVLASDASATGRLRQLKQAALISGGIGVGLLALGAILLALEVPGMNNAMPGFVVPGVILCIVAAALTAWLVVKTRLLPGWVAVVLAATAALLPGANEQNDSILLAIPFGLAWLGAGILLLARWSTGQRPGSSGSSVAPTRYQSSPGSHTERAGVESVRLDTIG